MNFFHLAIVRMAKNFDFIVYRNEGLFGNFFVSICIVTICVALFVVDTLGVRSHIVTIKHLILCVRLIIKYSAKEYDSDGTLMNGWFHNLAMDKQLNSSLISTQIHCSPLNVHQSTQFRLGCISLT